MRLFAEFVERTQREPVTEDLFKQCFKMSYNDMLVTFRAYTQDTDYKSTKFKSKKGGIPDPAPLTLQDATEAEVGRIKGETLRMAGYKEAAHLALIAPYVRGSRDPDLLASLGLEEHGAAQDDRAVAFLEAAVAAKTSRARAYLELGQIRLAQAKAKPAGAGGKLSTDQLVQILTPLFAGRGVPPEMPESYETIAEVWSHAEAKPTRDNLRVLILGVNHFPSDPEPDDQAAVLHAENGFKDDATKFADPDPHYPTTPPARALSR